MIRRPKKLPSTELILVGIGASAGGLEVTLKIISQLPEHLNLALVIVQHQDPNQPSDLVKILATHSKLPILEIKNQMKLEAGKIYINPAKNWVALLAGRFILTPRRDLPGSPSSIDRFFSSMATHQRSKNLGVLLSGKGSDGKRGLEAIVTHGGISLAQKPSSAKYSEMPQNAISAEVVDFQLTPKQIGKKLIEIAENPDHYFPRKQSARSQTKKSSLASIRSEDALEPIFNLLKNQFQADFSHYKATTLMRRVERRIAILKMGTLNEYLRHLDSNPQEVRALFDDLLIKVTEFFRDSKSFIALKKKVISKVLKSKLPHSPIRVWITGCASGEEAYSVAMSWIEAIEESGKIFTIQIFATDISDVAIQKARAGVYPHGIEKNVSPERLNRFFIHTEHGYKIKKEVRELCLFSKHDLTQDPPFVKIDLICCRNLMIYFDSSLQKRVLPVLLYALNPGGFLWLGRSESVGRLSSLFRVADKSHRFYFREKDQIIPKLDFPTRTFWAQSHESHPPTPRPPNRDKSDLQNHAEELLLAEYAPPGVLINSRNEVVLAKGDTSPYLQLPRGAVSLNLFKMARPEILSELRIAVQSTRRKNNPTKKRGIIVLEDAQKVYISITVFPLNGRDKNQNENLLVLFQKVSDTNLIQQDSLNPNQRSSSSMKSRRISELEEELLEAKSYQQSLVEDFEATQEEVTSTNEELQSANEELQSTIEELETAKEELQSTNEELLSVNEELRTRNNELLQLNNDLINLLGSVDLPIIMLGADGRIRRFTPRASQFFNLIPSDIGRSIGDVKPNFICRDLKHLVNEVTDQMTAQEHEVKTAENRWFRLQIRPYKTTDHRIEGAVISLIDITFLKESLIASQAALRYATSIADTLPLPLIVLDDKLHILSTNTEFSRVFQMDAEKIKNLDLISVLKSYCPKQPSDDFEVLEHQLKEVITQDLALSDQEGSLEFSELGRRTVLINAQVIHWQEPLLEPLPRSLLISIKDITERRVLERKLRTAQERFKILIKEAHDAILIVDSCGQIEFANRQAYFWFRYRNGELISQPVEALIPERFHAAHIQFKKKYIKKPVPRRMSQRSHLLGKRKDGTEFPVDISLSPIHLDQEVHVAVMIRDISNQTQLTNEVKVLFEQEKKAHQDAETARGEAVLANEAKDIFLATLSHELRTPLTSILVWAQLLKRIPADSEKFKKGLSVIEESAQSQGQLINDLIDVSRIQSGKLSLILDPLDPTEVIDAVANSVRLIAERKKIEIQFNNQLSHGRVYADRGRIQQIMWNLLTNSIKFSPENSIVTITSSKVVENSKNYVALEVKDKGKGIDPKFLPFLFTRFSQQDSSITRIHGGLGIGLALVQDLTKAQGGFVRAHSPGINQGATFTVYLPILENASSNTQTHSKVTPIELRGTPNLSGLKILVVDDEPSALEVFSEAIQAFGGKPIRCASAKEAWSQFQKDVPDLIVSDLAMPIEDGYALIRKIRALPASQGGNVPAIALTAFVAHHDIERALAAGFQDHLAKPIRANDLGQAILRLAHKK
jgi:PAS domain S-box-containing protein